MDRHFYVLVLYILAWLAASIAYVMLALTMALARAGYDARLDRVHAAGMELGQQMCLGLRPEAERRPAPRSAGPALGGLL